MSALCWLVQGQITSAATVINTSTGQAKRSKGRKKADNPRPLANQTTISLSWYIRDSVLSMAINSDKVRMVGKRPKAAYAMMSMTSCGLMEPREARPRV